MGFKYMGLKSSGAILLLHPSSGWVLTYDSSHSWWLYSACCPIGEPGHQYHHLISHSGTLSLYWASQSLLYPNNANCLARMQQVSILKSSFDLTRVRTHKVRIPWSPKLGDERSIHTAIPSGRKVGSSILERVKAMITKLMLLAT